MVEDLLADPAPATRAAEALGDAGELVAVGRGYLMCVALEAALKLREAAGVRAEGWSAADFRHGPVTVARGDIPLLAVSASGPAAADVEELAGELEGAGTRCCAWPTGPAPTCPIRAAWRSRCVRCPAAVRAQQLALALALRSRARPRRAAGAAQGDRDELAADPPGAAPVTAATKVDTAVSSALSRCRNPVSGHSRRLTPV